MNTPGPPLLSLRAVSKLYGGEAPLRVQSLDVAATDRVIVLGLDAGAAEMFVHLVTGAALPDEGTVTIDGRNTRDITTDTEWLSSLDRFGLVTSRAVLIDKLPTAANLALPLTLAIDPMSDATRADVERLAAEVRLPRERLDVAVAELTPAERVRVHLARALATSPALLLLEQPTATVTTEAERADLAATMVAVSASRGIGWLALALDEPFGRATESRRLTIDENGRLKEDGTFWQRLTSWSPRRTRS